MESTKITIKEFYTTIDPNGGTKIITDSDLNTIKSNKTSYFIIKHIKSGNMVLYTATRHEGQPPARMDISHAEFNSALELANNYSYEEILKQSANNAAPTAKIAKIAIYLGICKQPMPKEVESILQVQNIQQKNKSPIEKAANEIRTNSLGHRKALTKLMTNVIRAKMKSNSAKTTYNKTLNPKYATNWATTANAASKIAKTAANTIRISSNAITPMNHINSTYKRSIIGLAVEADRIAAKTAENAKNAQTVLNRQKGGRKTRRNKKSKQPS